MAIAMLIRLPWATAEQYDGVMGELGLPLHAEGPNWPKGIISHAAGVTDDGLFVVDVWESRAEFDSFVESRLGPAMAKQGDMTPPEMTQVDLINTYGHHRPS